MECSEVTATSTIGSSLSSRFITTGSSASSGRLYLMASTFLVASIAALSASASNSSSTVTLARSYWAVDWIFFTFEREDRASSTGLTTCCSTDSALAPGYFTITVIYGVFTAGKSSTPIRIKLNKPNTTKRHTIMDMPTGRLMENFVIFINFHHLLHPVIPRSPCPRS